MTIPAEPVEPLTPADPPERLIPEEVPERLVPTEPQPPDTEPAPA
jgi:hypothetical protein